MFETGPQGRCFIYGRLAGCKATGKWQLLDDLPALGFMVALNRGGGCIDHYIAANHGMQRSGGGAVSREIIVNSRRPLIPVVTPLN